MDHTEALKNLPVENLKTYFDGLRSLLDEVNKEANLLSEQTCYGSEIMSSQLSLLRESRTKLCELKKEIVQNFSEYQKRCKLFQDKLRKRDLSVSNRLLSISELQEELNYLHYEARLVMVDVKVNKSAPDSAYQLLGNVLLDSLKLQDGEMNLTPNQCARLNAKRQKLVETLRDSASKKAAELLKDLRYPFENAMSLGSMTSQINRLCIYLKCVRTANDCRKDLLMDWETILDVLCKPLERRFEFHFHSNQKTNDLSKPEWFFTQILTWLNCNMVFVTKISAQLSPNQEQALELQYSFLNRVLKLPWNKVRSMLDKVSNNYAQFTHLIDECVAFERDLIENGFERLKRSQYLKLIDSFCEGKYLDEWLSIERQSCILCVENLFTEDRCWENRYCTIENVDQYRVPNCTDKFVILMESVIERSQSISDLNVKYKFWKLLVILLEDYRLRLVQIAQENTSPWNDIFIKIMNSARYIAHVMDEWNELPMFLQLLSFGVRPHSTGIFDEICDLYRQFWRQKARVLSTSFKQHIEYQFVGYSNEDWFARQAVQPSKITDSMCPFLLEVRRLLTIINAFASPDSIISIYRMMNSNVAEVIYHFVRHTTLSKNSATQITYDIAGSLIPLVNSFYNHDSPNQLYTALDEPKFVDAMAILRLLCIPPEAMIHLYLKLKRMPAVMVETTLKKFDASTIRKEVAIEVTKQRCDLKICESSVPVTLRIP